MSQTRSLEQRIERLQETVDRDRQELARAEGALETSMKRLKQEFDIKSVEAGKKELTKLEREAEELEQKLIPEVEKLEGILYG